jgi:hypothetical protein
MMGEGSMAVSDANESVRRDRNRDRKLNKIDLTGQARPGNWTDQTGQGKGWSR